MSWMREFDAGYALDNRLMDAFHVITDNKMRLRKEYIYTSILAASAVGAAFAEETPDAFSEPSPAYLEQFLKSGVRQFVFERFDANGALHERSVEELTSAVIVLSAVSRQVNGHLIELRGLTSCPRDPVTYNGQQEWACKDAAADYMNAIYNERASVVLCKTLVLSPAIGKFEPSSCFALVGDNKIDAFDVVNDDDTMVFLGLAGISFGADGKSLRPDLAASEALSKETGVGVNAQ
jgi:hypothetical protein